MSGRLLSTPPSKWESDYLPFVLRSLRYQAEHDGELPNVLAWDRLERRFDVNPERFTLNHPTVAQMIARSREHETTPRPDVWPIDRCSPYLAECEPRCEQPPPCGPLNPQVVPEPSALALALVAAIVYMGVMWRRRP